MSTYNLNEALKKRAARQQSGDKKVTLDDLSRVKVLSPGRRVFKRFIRNRLAVFGSILLIAMFVFSFIGPLFYPYGQKQIFYKYDTQNVNYAMAKENTAYLGFDLDPSQEVERSVANAMNSRIKSMIANGSEKRLEIGQERSYLIERLQPDIYQVSVVETTPVCSFGHRVADIGTYTMVGKKIDYAAGTAPVEGLLEAVQAAVAKDPAGGTFEAGGMTFTYTRGKAKSYALTAEMDGVSYTGEPLDAGFETALTEAAGKQDTFEYGGETYALAANRDAFDIYRLGAATPARIFSRLTVDTMETGATISTELRVAAMLAAGKSDTFTAEGKEWQIRPEGGSWIISDAAGNEYMELTPFSVRRYNGSDTMAYDLKKAVAARVSAMLAAGEKKGQMSYDLPMQTADGEYARDEEGNVRYTPSEITISRMDTGEYVLNCDQVIYVIDMFAAPSSAHILGTDGDGFDVLSRIMYGGRVSLMVGFVVVFLESFLGIIMGGLAGYYGGWVDMLIMRLVDIFYCLPSLPIMIILGATMDALRMDTYLRLLIMMAALGIMGWASVARLVRGQILSLREQEFMVATEATGIRVRDRILHHLIPNIMPQLIVQATMGMGGVILTESTLSFLGLGVKHPLATWGTIINSVSSASAMKHYAFIWIPVGLLICVTVIAFNFVGDGLRDAYDPKAKR